MMPRSAQYNASTFHLAVDCSWTVVSESCLPLLQRCRGHIQQEDHNMDKCSKRWPQIHPYCVTSLTCSFTLFCTGAALLTPTKEFSPKAWPRRPAVRFSCVDMADMLRQRSRSGPFPKRAKLCHLYPLFSIMPLVTRCCAPKANEFCIGAVQEIYSCTGSDFLHVNAHRSISELSER